ncbi:MAG: branched-chain amino acid ABC transporter ATP-binding protein/permease, partial [Pseudomonadota bacterium]
MTGLSALSALPRHRAGVQIGETVLLVALLVAVSVGLWLVLGRTGERIATQMLVNVCAVVALSVFTGNSGIVSFGHAAFMALGAYLAGLLTMPALMQRTAVPQLPAFLAGHELAFPVALAVVLVAGLVITFLVGLPIARLTGASATIATLGLLIIVHSVLVGAREITRGSQTFFGVPRVTSFEVALAAAVVFAILARLFRESRWGLELRAVRDNESAAEAVGIDARRARLVGWTVSGGLAAVAGALYGHMLGAFSPGTFYFSLTFALVAMLIVGGMATVSGAVCGVVVVTLLQDTVRQLEGGFTVGGVEMPAVFGLTTVALSMAILLVIWLRPEGLLGRREARLPGFGALFRAFGPAPASAEPAPHSEAVPLDINGLSKRFAGLKAVDGATFAVAPATVTGLIGPNGAGKSTLVNLLTGQFTADEGTARFGETSIAGMSPHKIAALGLARTFQNIRLFGNLSVYENILVAALSSAPSARAARERALREMEALDLGALADQFADSLPYGARKRLEIARCLAMEPSMILLDEPAAGMNPDETSDLADRLVHLTDERGIGLLLIDHDLEFVNRLSSSIVVINRGQVIAEGTPAEIRSNEAVIEAYIGR